MGSIEKRAPGKYRARYRDPGGRQRSRTFKKKGEAERYLSQIETDVLRGSWLDPAKGKTTYKAWSESYLEGAVHKRATTMVRDLHVNEKHLVPALGKRALSSIAPLDVQGVVRTMSTTLAPATVRTNYGVLRAVLRAAVEAGMIAASPCRGVKLPTPAPKPIRYLTMEELNQLAAAVPPGYRTVIYLAGILGLRWSEVAGLRVGRINFFAKTLAVTETCAEVKGKLSFHDVKTKSSRRTLGVPNSLIDMLSEHLAARDRPGPDELVFTMPDGGPLRASTFRNRVMQPAVEATGLTGMTFHHLRHTAVGQMIDVGAHPMALKNRLGHASAQTSMDVYGHVLPTTDEAITEALDAKYLESCALDVPCDETGTER